MSWGKAWTGQILELVAAVILGLAGIDDTSLTEASPQQQGGHAVNNEPAEAISLIQTRDMKKGRTAPG